MKPGNAAALYNQLETFCKPAHGKYTYTSENGDTYPIYHTQFATYQISRLADTIIEIGNSTDVSHQDNLIEFGRILDKELQDQPWTKETFSDASLYPQNSIISPRDVSTAVTTLGQITSDTDKNTPSSLAELACDIITVYNHEIALQKQYGARDNAAKNARYEDDLSREKAERQTDEALTAMISHIRHHEGHTVFGLPEPDPITITELWKMIQETGFRHDISHEWVYSLYLDHRPISSHMPADAIDQELRTHLAGIGIPEKYQGNTSEKWESESEPPISDVVDDNGYVTLENES
jgi:hypothetical protein